MVNEQKHARSSRVDEVSEILMTHRHKDFPEQTYEKIMRDQSCEREELKEAMRYLQSLHADYMHMRTLLEELKSYRDLAAKGELLNKLL